MIGVTKDIWSCRNFASVAPPPSGFNGSSTFSLTVAVNLMYVCVVCELKACLYYLAWSAVLLYAHSKLSCSKDTIIYFFCAVLLHFAWVEDHETCIVVTCICVSVCASVHGHMPTLLHRPGCKLGECALLGGFAIGARDALLWQRYGNAWQSPAVIRQAQRMPHALRMHAPAIKSMWRLGVYDVICNETVPFCPYCAGVATRTRNVSEYMLVQSLCLVVFLIGLDLLQFALHWWLFFV